MSEPRRLTRSCDDKMIAGVCGGIAEHFGWSATRFRIVYFFGSLLSAAFPGVVVYLALWYLLPEAEPGEAG